MSIIHPIQLGRWVSYSKNLPLALTPVAHASKAYLSSLSSSDWILARRESRTRSKTATSILSGAGGALGRLNGSQMRPTFALRTGLLAAFDALFKRFHKRLLAVEVYAAMISSSAPTKTLMTLCRKAGIRRCHD